MPGRFLQNANPTLQTINICDALHKDEEAIIGLLNSAIELEGNKFKDALLTLKGEDMQSCADLIQDVIDKCSLEHDKFKHKAQHLLVKLCKDQDVLPSSLFIKGVILQDTNAHFGGSFGDIYGVTYNGLEVVVKWISALLKIIAGEQPPQPLNMGEWLWTVVERCWNQKKHVRPSMSEAVEMMQSGSLERELVLSFSVQQSSGGASDTAYPQHIMHGQTAHMLPIITSLDHALDEIDLTSGIETPIKTGYTFDNMSVGQTVGIVKKKKKPKMHACEICHKLFLHPSSLKMHMITHNNLKSFICNFPGCNRSFTVCSNAKQHLQTHGVTPESFMPSSPDYVVNFDTHVVPDSEGHPLSSLPAKLKWMPTSLLDRNNMTTLRSISEDREESDSDSDKLEDDPVICIWKIYQLTWQVT
uniref:C2H2-type domain-containing protein n=1 Tax=Moniliophthora roreri TaxID=221103 RepID=A0A0W0FXE1_MONRR